MIAYYKVQSQLLLRDPSGLQSHLLFMYRHKWHAPNILPSKKILKNACMKGQFLVMIKLVVQQINSKIIIST